MLVALAPVLLARECFRQDVVAPAESETAGSPWSLDADALLAKLKK